MSRWNLINRGRANRPVLHGFDITPDANWNGTAGSGAPAPALDTSLQGAGFYCHPAANMLEVPGTWIGYDGLDNEAPHPITIHADTSDAAGIKEVRIYMEGASLVVNQVAWNPLHSNFGYLFVPYATATVAGEAQVVIDVVPYNGYIRRLGPYTLTLNTNALLTRAQVYVDYANGTDDTTSGRGSSAANPWKTVQYALRQCTDASANKGAIIRVAPGVQKESVNPLSTTRNKNTRQIAIAPYIGHSAQDTTFTWSDPTGTQDGRFYNDPVAKRGAGCIEVGALLVRFHNLSIDLAHIVMWYPSGVGSHWDFHKCQMVDSNGPAGAVDSNPAWATAWITGGAKNLTSPMPGIGYWGITQVYFRNNEGGFCYLTECNSVNYVMTGARGLRNVTHTGTFDVGFINNSALTDAAGNPYTVGDNTWFCNYTANIVSGYPQRLNAADHFTVASAVYNGLNTIITVNEDASIVANGTPGNNAATNTMVARNSSQQFCAYKWLTGANIGRSSGGAGFEASSYDESQSYGGAHLKAQYMYSSGTVLVVTPGAPGVFANQTTAGAASAHNIEAGAPIVFYTTGTLPTGLAAGRTYYVSKAGFSATAFQICATQADALAGANPLAISDAGSGSLTFECRCIVVNGDFSTATGHTNVGDAIRAYILAHADTVQFSQATSLNTPNVQNITLQGYVAYGSGMGNQFLFQTAWANGAALAGNGSYLYAVPITAAAGSTSFSCPAGKALWPHDFLRVADTTHPSYGEAVRVLAYNATTGTGTLAQPFSADLAGANCLQVKSCYAMSWQNTVIANTSGWNGVTGQWAGAVANLTIRHSTIVSQASGAAQPQTSEFDLRNKKGSNTTLTQFGLEALLIKDSILEGASAESVWPAQAKLVNCRLRRLTNGATQAPVDATSSVADVSFNANWSPSFAGTPQFVQGLSSVCPWSLTSPLGRAIARPVNAAVGAAS